MLQQATMYLLPESRVGTAALAAVSALGAIWVLLRLRLMPQWFMKAWFCVSFLTTILPMIQVSAPVHFVADHMPWLLSKESAHRFSRYTVAIALKAHCYMQPQMRFRLDLSEVEAQAAVEHAKAGRPGKPPTGWDALPLGSVTVMNHVSIFDAIASGQAISCSRFRDQRGMVKSSVASAPGIGRLFFDYLNHFPVYFVSNRREEFNVDREKQEGVQRLLRQWVLAAKGLMLITIEGAVNANPDVVMMPRFGSVKTIMELSEKVRRGGDDMLADAATTDEGDQAARDALAEEARLVALHPRKGQGIQFYRWIYWGYQDFWPANHTIGGCPADVTVKLSPIENWPPAGADVPTAAKALREIMQDGVNELLKPASNKKTH
jgi:hypothetical protein